MTETMAERIASALVQDRGFMPLEDTQLDASRLVGQHRYAFVGVREYWGSIMSCALLPLAHEDQHAVSDRAAEFYAFSSSLKAHAGSVSGARLGGFGLLVVLVAGPTSEGFRRWVAGPNGAPHGARTTVSCGGWTNRHATCFAHRWFPIRFYPDVDFFRRLLKGDATGTRA
jgi:hypothetical protein